MKFPKFSIAARVAFLYILFGSLWILFSDSLLESLVSDAHALTKLQTYKGWAYVLASGLLIFVLLQRELRIRSAVEWKFDESEERYGQLFEYSLDAILLTSPDGVIHAANPAACQMFQRTEEEIKQVGRNGLVDVADPRLKPAVEERARTGKFHGELTFIRKDGTKFEGDITTSVFQSQNGILHSSMTIRDISARKQAEGILRQSEERSSKMFRSSPAAIIISRVADGKFIDVNDAACQIYGYSREELIGHTSLELGIISPQERNKLVAALTSQGLLRGVELTIHSHIDGDREVLYSMDLLEIDGVPCMLTAMNDITERKRAEKELQESQERYRNLFESNPHPMWVYDLETLAFLMVNDSAIQNYGYSRDEFLGMTIKDIRPKEDLPALMENIKTSQKIFQSSRGWRHIKKDGSIINVEISSHSLQFDGRPARLIMANDITEQLRTEEKIQQQLRRLSILRNVDQAIAGTLNLRLVLSTVLKHIKFELGLDAAVVLLYDTTDDTLKYEYGVGMRTEALKYTHLKIGEGYAGRSALGRKTVFISNLQTHTTDFLRSPSFAQEGFVCYFGVPLIAKGATKGVLELFHRSHFEPEQEWLDFMETLAGQMAIAIDNATLYNDLQLSHNNLILAYDATIAGWSRAMDLRDKETEGHTQRVTDLTLKLAQKFGIPDSQLLHYRRGALLHDIGKMGIPDGILLKEGPLTSEEWVMMRKHPIFARDMLAPIQYLKGAALEIPYSHHEKWDGTGYPQGLRSEQIPLSARIFAVADVWDALTSDRTYRAAWSKERTIAYLREQSGTHFDPAIVEVFLNLLAAN
jgi:PAS domain S-box-containing protein